jgi:hypothetical protein
MYNPTPTMKTMSFEHVCRMAIRAQRKAKDVRFADAWFRPLTETDALQMLYNLLYLEGARTPEL